MAPPLLHLQDIVLSHGGRPLLDGASLAVGAGERVCLVGRNGSGKSTLLRVAAGEVAADGGTRFVQPGAVLRVLPQEPDLSGHATTLDYAADGLDEEQRYRAVSLLHELGLTGSEATGRLSGGEARRAALARVLAPSPDVILLDEPTNHLDVPAIEWLERELAGLRSAIVLISHDRRLLQTVSRSVVWLDRGTTRRLEQGFARFEAWREEVLEQEERDAHKLDRQIAREEDWMRYGVTARRKRNVRRVAELAALRQARREAIKAPGTIERMDASEAGMSGKLVAVAEGLERRFDGRAVVTGLDLRVLRGDRLGIVGANGAGKTTILRLLTGLDQPDGGRVTLGSALSVVTLDQQRRTLRDAETLADTLTGGGGDIVQVGEERRHVVGYMKEFLFRPEQARTPVGSLSGGERARLLLARAMATPSNLLVLDEPTNDLDLETLDLLQEMLAAYPGTVLLVSHDRDFLDRVATSVLAAAGNGRWIEYAGGYGDMLAQGGGLGGGLGGGPAGTPAPPAAAKAEAPRERAAGRGKLSFKDRHALDRLPGVIAGHEERIAGLRAELADPELYRRDRKRFDAATATLEREEAALAEAEERWLELEVLRESLEAG